MILEGHVCSVSVLKFGLTILADHDAAIGQHYEMHTTDTILLLLHGLAVLALGVAGGNRYKRANMKSDWMGL
jgi:hypothetical protein